MARLQVFSFAATRTQRFGYPTLFVPIAGIIVWMAGVDRQWEEVTVRLYALRHRAAHLARRSTLDRAKKNAQTEH
jgi:hypothetical protein